MASSQKLVKISKIYRKIANMIQTLDGENKSLILRSNHASKEFLAKLQHMRQQDQFTDVILTTEDGKQVKAHKIVLCCSSNYFEVMFCGQFCENPQSEIHLKEVFYNPLRLCPFKNLPVTRLKVLFSE